LPAISIADLRTLAKARLPRAIFEYIDGGSTDERTLAANRAAFETVTLQPRCLIDVSQCSQKTTVLGRELASPLILAPIGLAGLAARYGEVAAAKAAKKENVGFALSTVSVCSIEDVRDAVGGDIWFQLYVMRDRGLTKSFIERARAVGCGALVLTVDVPVQGPRERDARNGLTIPPRITLRNAVDMFQRLPWIFDVMVQGPRLAFGNFQMKGERIAAGAQFVAQAFDPTITWKDIAWFKSVWGGPLVLKGVLNPKDAIIAADLGVDALVVSNHGGRQLDGASASFAALPAIVDAVGERLEILVDGGIRRGSDVVKCIALGARACLIGRSFVYGLAAGGEAGVQSAIQILKREINTALGLLGVPDIRAVDRNTILSRGLSEFDPPIAAALQRV
jgi:L-lactate dehydrogenase (cytochrome)